jgi:hypothetical protein
LTILITIPVFIFGAVAGATAYSIYIDRVMKDLLQMCKNAFAATKMTHNRLGNQPGPQVLKAAQEDMNIVYNQFYPGNYDN